MLPQSSEKGIGALTCVCAKLLEHIISKQSIPIFQKTKFQHLYSMAFDQNTHAKASF